jgi:hypothetical protein
MAYGLSTRLFIENGPAIEAAKAQQRSSAEAHSIVWQRLHSNERLALIDSFLRNAA